MKIKTLAITCISVLSLASLSSGAVTINFNSPYLGGVSSRLANSSGVVTNGMTWGIVVDATGGGFGASFDGMVDGAALMSGSVATNNYFYLGGTTSDSSQGGLIDEGNFAGTGAGDGGIGAMAFSFVGAVGANNPFRVVWVSEDGKGGYLSDASFLLPADGQIVTYDAPFVGVDPIRTAGLAYAGTSADSVGQGFVVVPEPSAILLGAVGVLGLLRRRRN